MLNAITSGPTRWLVSVAAVLVIATGLYITANHNEQLVVPDDIIVIRSSQSGSIVKKPVDIIDSPRRIDLAKLLEEKFAFVGRSNTLCNGDTCVVSGQIDMSKEMQSGDIKRFLYSGLMNCIVHSGYAPMSDIDTLILSENDIRFSLKYRTVIKK